MHRITIKRLTSNLATLDDWLKERFFHIKDKTTTQRISASVGLVIGICSSVVIFFLSYNFGLYLGKWYFPEWLQILGFYFGITAVIPLSFLAGRTSSYVLQALAASRLPLEEYLFDNKYQKNKRKFNIVVWVVALLSAIPFFYLTHTYLYPLISWWVLPFDIAAIIAPIFVNSWALSSASDNFIYIYYQIKKDIFKNELFSYQTALLKIQQRLESIGYIISRLRTNETETLYQSIANQRRFEDIFNLSITKTKSYQEGTPLGERLFSYAGAIIGAVSEYQYFGTGRDAALWLHIPYILAIMVGIASLICNSTLMGYTGKIVFRQMYCWLDRQLSKLKKMEKILSHSVTEAATQQPFYEWLKIYIKKAFGDATNIIVLIIAISAATPNVYLTILQQKAATWYNFVWLLIAFLGPFCTNFYVLSKVLHETNCRHQLLNTLAAIINTLPHFKPKYLLTLKYLASTKSA